jgi:ribonuclease HI
VIIAAADGSALGNPGPAGWAWYVDEGRWASGGWPRGTNNMGELMAVLDLLQQTAHVDEPLRVYCDSTYVINTVTKWMAGWKRRGWRKGDGKPVMNVELVKALDAAMQGRDVDFVWVKGHSGHELNEAADKLANAAAAAYRDGRAPEPGPGIPDSSIAHPLATVGQVEPEADLFSGLEPEEPGGPSAAAPEIDLERVSLDLLDADTVRLGWRASTDPPAAVRSTVWVRSGGQWQARFHQGTDEP